MSLSRRNLLGVTLASVYVVFGAQKIFAVPAFANQITLSDWEKVDLPIAREIVLLDIGFSDDKHGFLLGTRQTLLETEDGGRTWGTREVPAALEEGINYRFNSISFNGMEGWIVGKPAILLHTTNAGRTWERIPLSAKLPGTPINITATGTGQAEMITDQGAIYVTSNAAKSWQAAVQETVDATLNRTVSSGISGASYFEGFFSNVSRAVDGQYVAVSSRGNFFMTWAPGERTWIPHNRPTGRRVQNMGWSPEHRLWLTTRGGEVLLGDTSTDDFAPTKLQSRGFGILGIGFRTSNVGYACGGSGSLYKTEDGGKTWKRDKSADDLAGNLYAVKFIAGSTGFVLGNDAILLRYTGSQAK
jgi:photosystem II stability/assembly factor-like uncharacterized protein